MENLNFKHLFGSTAEDDIPWIVTEIYAFLDDEVPSFVLFANKAKKYNEKSIAWLTIPVLSVSRLELQRHKPTIKDTKMNLQK